MIDGVIIKELVTRPDERGFFREVIRVTDPFFREGFGQLSHSLVYAGVVKAWHIHKVQVDWWYVASGLIKVGLHDLRETSPTYRETNELLFGDNQNARVLCIPPGVAHGYRGISPITHLFYVTSNVYNPDDEGRIPYDAPNMGIDWLKGPEIT